MTLPIDGSIYIWMSKLTWLALTMPAPRFLAPDHLVEFQHQQLWKHDTLSAVRPTRRDDSIWITSNLESVRHRLPWQNVVAATGHGTQIKTAANAAKLTKFTGMAINFLISKKATSSGEPGRQWESEGCLPGDCFSGVSHVRAVFLC